MSGFVHLHLHSEYSLLDAACRISDIPKFAKKAGHDAVAITDHGVMYGAVAFYKACKNEGVKPIIGCEVYVAETSRYVHNRDGGGYYHLILLVKNETGYRNLIYMVSKSFSDGFYVKPRIDMELLETHSEGLIALSACIAGYVPQTILRGDFDEAEKMVLKMKRIFGEENYYLEIQDHGLSEEKVVNKGLVSLSEKTGVGLAATNDVHYLDRSHAVYQDVLMCIQTNETVDNDDRPLRFATEEYYYKSTAEMEALFSGFAGAIENTEKIASMCSFDFDFSKLYLPRYVCPVGISAGDYLRSLAEQGFKDKVSSGKIVFDEKNTEKVYLDRIGYELSVIETMGYSEYFLIVYDFVHFAKSKRISVGPGRGSGAASFIAYLIGITDIDPVRYELIFESFLNVDRVSMPDFDIDFADKRREEVIDYVKAKYGEDHVSQIITFGTLSARAVVRDVGRALGMPYSTVDRIAKLIPRELNVKLSDCLRKGELSERYTSDSEIKKLIDTSLALEGMPRHASTHAAGVVITDRPVYEYVPLASNSGNMLTQFDMDTVAELGLLKFDFLGIRYLTVIEEAVRQIKLTEPSFDIENIPYDDPKTYSLICKGNTEGVFQLNSSGMRAKLIQIKPESFDDIIAAIALYRPGPLKAGAIDAYAVNKHDRSKITYSTGKLAPILDSTFGCLIYTEQITQIFRDLAGYSFSEADNVRRAIKKKKGDVIENERGRFIKGAVEQGVPQKVAEKIFADIEGFSEYAFNKSHATAYAVTAYRTAYLKAHYLKEYYSALISSEMSYQDKVNDYISELKKSGISVLPPDVNYSNISFSVDGDSIRFGLLAILNVGRPLVSFIINERLSNGRYRSLDDFIVRCASSDLNRRQYEMLVKSGALDSLGVNRNALLALTDKVADFRSSLSNSDSSQMDLFSMLDGDEDAAVHERFKIPDIPEMPEEQKLRFEKESLGLYISGNLINRYSEHISKLGAVNIKDLVSAFSNEDTDHLAIHDGSNIVVCGLVNRITNKKTKNGDPMSFVTVEDSSGETECICFASVLAKYGYLLTQGNAIAVSGRVSVKDDDVSVIAVSVTRLEENGETDKTTAGKTLYIKIDYIGSELYDKIHDVIVKTGGDTPVVFYSSEKKKYFREVGIAADVSERSLSALIGIAGEDSVVLK